MKFSTLIAKNARWTANKNAFGYLWAVPTTKENLNEQLKSLGEMYYCERKKVDVAMTEFCLNYLALKHPTTRCQREVLRRFDGYWQRFLRLRSIFERDLTFPSDGITRIEKVARLITKCTAFYMDNESLADVLHDCEYLANLTRHESEYLPLVVDLYRINYFCALGWQVFAKNPLAEKCLAKLFYNEKNCDILPTTAYGQATYKTENLESVCNCLGGSILRFDGKNLDTYCKMLLYKHGRNCFDTFCFHKFFSNRAVFESNFTNGKITQNYFLQDDCEVRKISLAHLGKSKCKFVVDIPVECDGEQVQLADGVLCFATQNCYVAVAVVWQNQVAKCRVLNDCLSFEFTLCPNEKICFDIVTIVAVDFGKITQKIADFNIFGATLPNEFCGDAVETTYTTPLRLTSSSNCFRTAPQKRARRLNFTYQMGSDDVATFVDNVGHQTTLMQGFVFGVGGEKVYSVENGRFCLLNDGQFSLDGKLTYQKRKSSCVVSHGEEKRIAVAHHEPTRTVYYLPFERKSKVKFANNSFYVDDGVRKYVVKCCGKVESYTTNGVEFCAHRLRYRLSGDLSCGDCLAICFAKDFQHSINLFSYQTTPAITPLVQESLVSTYLNYVNGKEVFCLNNLLKKARPLALASINYTNPQFVKQYLTKLWQNGQNTAYYDNCGRLQKHASEWLFDLACVYYATLTKDENFPTAEMKSYANTHLLSAKYVGADVVLQALTLKKASQIDGFDKVKCLVQLASLTKEISADKNLTELAQITGVLPLKKPCKEYLKQLCTKHDLPKNWYYVSQLENLYGLHLVGASLRVCPTALEEKLEKFALNFGKKRIYTTFTKGALQTMTLNGTTCCQPFDPYSLTIDQNTLVVSY